MLRLQINQTVCVLEEPAMEEEYFINNLIV